MKINTKIQEVNEWINIQKNLRVENCMPDFLTKNPGNLFENHHHASFFYDFSSQKFARVSQAFEQITGHRSEDLINGGYLFFARLIHPDDLPKVLTIKSKMLDNNLSLPAHLRTRATGKLIYRMIHRNGDPFWVMQTVNTVALDKNHLPAIDHCTLTDIHHLQNEYSVCGAYYHPEMGKKTINPNKILNTLPVSERELEVMRMLDRGLTSKQVAYEFSLSPETVNRHRKNILKKLNAANMIEAIKMTRENGLL